VNFTAYGTLIALLLSPVSEDQHLSFVYNRHNRRRDHSYEHSFSIVYFYTFVYHLDVDDGNSFEN